MKTQHGVTMSPRMERLWTFIKERRIPLSDWSTDGGVRTCMTQLEGALAEACAQPQPDRALLTDLLALIERGEHAL